MIDGLKTIMSARQNASECCDHRLFIGVTACAPAAYGLALIRICIVPNHLRGRVLTLICAFVQDVGEAYAILSDATKRRQYDAGATFNSSGDVDYSNDDDGSGGFGGMGGPGVRVHMPGGFGGGGMGGIPADLFSEMLFGMGGAGMGGHGHAHGGGGGARRPGRR
jgi:hypothetical protein